MRRKKRNLLIKLSFLQFVEKYVGQVKRTTEVLALNRCLYGNWELETEFEKENIEHSLDFLMERLPYLEAILEAFPGAIQILEENRGDLSESNLAK